MIKDMVTSLVWPSKEQVLQYEMHNLRTPSPTNLKTDTLNLPLSVFTKVEKLFVFCFSNNI